MLIASLVLQGLGLALSLAVLGVKAATGGLWFFQQRQVVDGTLVTSNSVVLFATLHIIHYV